MSVFRFTVTTVPGSEMLPNRRRRDHWSVLSVETTRCRKHAKYDVMNVFNGSRGPVRVADWERVKEETDEDGMELNLTVVWPVTMSKMPDLDSVSAACKGIIDGICDGLEIDDSLFTYLGIEQVRHTRPDDPYILVSIRPNIRGVGEHAKQ
jgi:hypothetical protein